MSENKDTTENLGGKRCSVALTGRWRVTNEGVFCGTLRIARFDFDTDPSIAFRESVYSQMATALNHICEDDAGEFCGHCACQSCYDEKRRRDEAW